MKKGTVIDLSSRAAENADPLTNLMHKLIEQEVDMEAFNERKLSDGRSAVVRNGYQYMSQLRNQDRSLVNNVFQHPECRKMTDWMRSPMTAL